MTHLLFLTTQCSIKTGNEFFHDKIYYLNDSLLQLFKKEKDKKKSAANKLLVVSRTNYAQISAAETMFRFSLSMKF